MSLQIVFSNDSAEIIEEIRCRNLFSRLGTLVVRNPELRDGMGERVVYDSDQGLKVYAEIISLAWIDDSGQEREGSFHGEDSYFLQSIVDELESMGS